MFGSFFIMVTANRLTSSDKIKTNNFWTSQFRSLWEPQTPVQVVQDIAKHNHAIGPFERNVTNIFQRPTSPSATPSPGGTEAPVGTTLAPAGDSTTPAPVRSSTTPAPAGDTTTPAPVGGTNSLAPSKSTSTTTVVPSLSGGSATSAPLVVSSPSISGAPSSVDNGGSPTSPVMGLRK